MRLHVVAPIKKIIIRLNLVNLLSLPLLIFRLCGIKRNKIVFSNYSGQGFGDNAKYYIPTPTRRQSGCMLVGYEEICQYPTRNTTGENR